jgi:hypothetical protein
MTNNNDTIALRSSTHGLYTVHTSHLNMTAQAHSGWSPDALLAKVHDLTGEGDYTDLTYIEALVLISYLTGGIASD